MVLVLKPFLALMARICPCQIFLVRWLAANLISIGQLVENNYSIQFSSFGCIVQDKKKKTRTVIEKGVNNGDFFF